MENSFFEDPKVVIAISLLWGIGIALLFKNNCPNNCVMIKVPPSFTSESQIYAGNRCFNLYQYQYPCVEE